MPTNWERDTNFTATFVAYSDFGVTSNGYFTFPLSNQPERRDGMRLTDMVYYLENILKTEKFPTGIIVSQDFGNHYNCLVDSNCPEAIKLRKVLTEAELNLPDIIKEWEESKAEKPKPLSYKLPEVSGKATISVAGKDIEIDLKDEIEGQIKYLFNDRLEKFKYSQEKINNLAANLFRNYLDTIIDARRATVLPQMDIPGAELIRYKCTVAKGGRDSYLFFFPFTYHPQWIITSGTRYDIHPEHIKMITRDVLVVFTINKEGKMIDRRLVEPAYLDKFQHYHGASYDCWGEMKMPGKWDWTVKSLADMVHKMEAALATINRDSLMNSQPAGMPSIPELLDMAKMEGVQGEVNTEVRTEEAQPAEVTDSPHRRHWGIGG
jgi:hypothetical protein